MKCIKNRNAFMKNKENAWFYVISFIKYALVRKREWSFLISCIIILNSAIGMIAIMAPGWMVAVIKSPVGEIKDKLMFILILEAVLLIGKVIVIWLKDRIEIVSDELYRCAYSDLGEKQSRLVFEKAISVENIELLEGAKYGIWDIKTMSTSIEGLGTALLVLSINIGILIAFDWRYVLLLLVCGTVSLPIYRKVTQIEVDNSKRLLPENRAFGWYCRLIADFKLGEDIRINQAEGMILNKCGNLMDRIYKINQRAFTKKGACQGLIRFIFQAQIVVVSVIAGLAFIKRQLEIDQFIMLFNVICAISLRSSDIADDINIVKKTGLLLLPFLKLLERCEKNQMQRGNECELGKGTVEFKDVSFSYTGNNKKVLDELSFTIHKGEHVGIVGRNGAGKSTVVKLLSKMYTPQEGKLLVDGIDISTIENDNYGTVISPVFQDYCLMPVTIIENIFCKPCKEIEDGERLKFQKCCKENDLIDWIEHLVKKEDTYITPTFSKDYVNPSGGQAQLLAILRAVLRESLIYIFDEPTLSLDVENEERLIGLINSLKGKTCIMISHRLSHVKKMDRIIVLDSGKIAESGTHEELMKKQGIYRDMYEKQAKKYGINLSKQ